MRLIRENNQGCGENMKLCSNITSAVTCVPSYQLIVPTADYFAALPTDPSEGAELCAPHTTVAPPHTIGHHHTASI